MERDPRQYKNHKITYKAPFTCLKVLITRLRWIDDVLEYSTIKKLSTSMMSMKDDPIFLTFTIMAPLGVDYCKQKYET